MTSFVGQDVSIKLKRDLGIFQGKIASASSDAITITNAFHNGVKLKKFDAEITISREEIENISFIQCVKPEEAASRFTPVAKESSSKAQDEKKLKESPPNFTNKKVNHNETNGSKYQQRATKPIPIRKNNTPSNGTSSVTPHSMKVDYQLQQAQPTNKRGNNLNGNNNYNNNNNTNANKKRNKNYDLMQPDDFNHEDFDFESNNAKFDKKSVYQEIEEENVFAKANEKPDLVRQLAKTEEKYRHDENVLADMFLAFKNIQLEFKPKQEYTTDEPGIVIPSIPLGLRNRIQNLASDHGYGIERQNELLARGATELALQLLGGSHRFSPKNVHQWPRVTIICDEPYNFKQSEIGLITGRQLASHGVNVMVYVKTSTTNSSKESKELELYTASGNDFTGNVKDLTPSDLVIMSVSNMNQNSQIIRYIQTNRAPVMAIDPPVTGINPGEINVRNTVIPILPLDDIHNTCGKLHLVNLCISEKFFKDAGVKYFPVFGSKFIIPLHVKQ